jgi:hypothetical protein
MPKPPGETVNRCRTDRLALEMHDLVLLHVRGSHLCADR